MQIKTTTSLLLIGLSLLFAGCAKGIPIPEFQARIVTPPDAPGVFYTTITLPRGRSELSCVMIFNRSGKRVTAVASAGTASTVVTEPAGISGSLQFDSEITIQQDAVRTTGKYLLTSAAAPGSTNQETLTVAGTTLDLRNGRVILLDLQSSPPTVTQLQEPLPSQFTVNNAQVVNTDHAAKIVAALRRTNSRIDEFCRRSEQPAERPDTTQPSATGKKKGST